MEVFEITDEMIRLEKQLDELKKELKSKSRYKGHIGNYLTTIREDSKINLDDFSKKIGVSKNLLIQLEQCKYYVPWFVLKLYSNGIGVEVDCLMKETGYGGFYFDEIQAFELLNYEGKEKTLRSSDINHILNNTRFLR